MADVTLVSKGEWPQEFSNTDYARPVPSTSKEVHEALFAGDFSAPAKTLAGLKQGIVRYMQRSQVRGRNQCDGRQVVARRFSPTHVRVELTSS